jgi:hypothetical protein
VTTLRSYEDTFNIGNVMTLCQISNLPQGHPRGVYVSPGSTNGRWRYTDGRCWTSVRIENWRIMEVSSNYSSNCSIPRMPPFPLVGFFPVDVYRCRMNT